MKRTSYWRVLGSGKGLVPSATGRVWPPSAAAERESLSPFPRTDTVQGIGLLGQEPSPGEQGGGWLGARPDLAAWYVDLTPAEADQGGDRGAVHHGPHTRPPARGGAHGT